MKTTGPETADSKTPTPAPGPAPAVVPSKVTAAAAPPIAEPEDLPTSLPIPIEIHDFVVYVTDEGVIRQEVSAQVAYLYQQLSVAYLRGIHVDFFPTDTSGTDTLDAYEGYLYLKNFAIDPKHPKEDERIGPAFPFYKQIGGKQASLDLLTTRTKLVGGLPERITRYKNDFDLMGRAGQKIIYRRSDGTLASCLRGYRDARIGKLYGYGACEFRTAATGKSQSPVMSARGNSSLTGQWFVTDDHFTGMSIGGNPQFGTGP